MPSTKPFRSGTWAITLLAMITSARLALGAQPAGELDAEELRAASGTPVVVGRGGLVRGRVDARAPGCPRSTKFRSR